MESNARRSSCGLTGVLLLGFVVDACEVAAVDAAFEQNIFGLVLIAFDLQAKLLASAIRCAATGARVVYVPFPEAPPFAPLLMIVCCISLCIAIHTVHRYSTCALSEAENDGAGRNNARVP